MDEDDDEGMDQQEDEAMSAESEVEVLHHVPPVPPNQKKRIHEVGKELEDHNLFFNFIFHIEINFYFFIFRFG